MNVARSAAAVAGALALGALVSGTATALELTTTTTEVTLPTTTTSTSEATTTTTSTTVEETTTTSTTEAPVEEDGGEDPITEALEEGLSIAVEATAEADGPVAAGAGEVELRLGAVTVTAPPIAPLSPSRSWVATVSLDAPGFTNGTTTIPPASVTYRSGTATAASSGVAVRVAGDAVPGSRTLDAPRTAFSASGIPSTGAVVVWEPRLEIDLPADAEPGDYEGTITHSVL